MSPTTRQLHEILSRYMSGILAKSVLERALSRARLDGAVVRPADLPRVLELLGSGLKLFVPEDELRKLEREIRALSGTPSEIPPALIPVVTERDVSVARLAARRMATGIGCGALMVQKIATVTSELARNIVNYTPGGQIELSPLRGPSKGVLIRAVDDGAGIGNLDEILNGAYRSKTGLGMGLKGTRRIASRFDIKTGANGTTVEVEILR